VAGAAPDVDQAALREESCRGFIELFEDTDHVISGEENLPASTGHIVVMNHLVNHIDNSLPNRFTLTLDSHFVSAMLLYRRYGHAPVRVIRASGPREYGHRRYYDRLGYIYVSSRVLGEESGRAIDPREFEEQAAATLAAGNNLVICPEGTSVPTEQSPTRFRPGVFRLAAGLAPEPLVVPVVVANFDKRLSEATTVAVVHPPFRVSEQVADPTDRAQLLAFLNDRLHPQYTRWVREAVALAGRA
jgi:1-acyl-sn-glycerol-3-phosphate acyltransferase